VTSVPPTAEAPAAFERLLGELRPKLHRYCARITGSVIDGEDVLQEAIVNAMVAAETMTGINGMRVYALPHDRLRAALRKYNRLVEPRR